MGRESKWAYHSSTAAFATAFRSALSEEPSIASTFACAKVSSTSREETISASFSSESAADESWRRAGRTTILFCSAMLFWYEPAICFALRVTRMCFVFARCERSFSRSCIVWSTCKRDGGRGEEWERAMAPLPLFECIVWSTFVRTPTKSNSERITDTLRSICE